MRWGMEERSERQAREAREVTVVAHDPAVVWGGENSDALAAWLHFVAHLFHLVRADQ